MLQRVQQTCAPAAYRLAHGALLTALALALNAAVSRPASAQTIKVAPSQLSAIANLGADQDQPKVYTGFPASSTNAFVGSFRTPSWIEFTFNVATAGVYSASIEYASVESDVLIIDVRSQNGTQRYASTDISAPSTGNELSTIRNTTAVAVPLQAGTNILRIHNVTAVRTTNHAAAPLGRINIASVNLTRTGALPATGAVSGRVTASNLGGIGVGRAAVMANPAGQTVPEPSEMYWYRGYWTTTDAAGNYTLTVPAGNYNVQAGRPDTYVLAGGSAAATVAAGGAATANISLASKWSNGTLTVESEYFHNKRPDVIGGDNATGFGFLPGGGLSNGYNLGWTDQGDFVDVFVDVAAGQEGLYNLVSQYRNGGGEGIVSYTADNGSATQDTQPSTDTPGQPGSGWSTTATKAFSAPIYLSAGRNRIRQLLVGGSSNFDAFTLSRRADQNTVRVEAESFINRGGGSAVSRTGGSSGISVDPSDQTSAVDGEKLSGGRAIGFFSSYSQAGGHEYVEYVVNVGVDGLYNVRVRGAFEAVDVTLRLWDLTYGAIIESSFNTGASGGFDATKMAKFDLANPMPLKAGAHVLRVYITSGGLNPDYIEFTRASALTGFGVVSGTVTAAGQPVARAQVAVDVSEASLAGASALGFRAVSDANGTYRLLLPNGARTLKVAAQGHDDPTAAGTNVNVTENGNLTQNLTLAYNGRYEAEWFDNATTNNSNDGDAVALADVADNGLGAPASQGQTIGDFEPGNFLEFNVTVPTASTYRVLLGYSSDSSIPLRIVNLSTGSEFTEEVPSSGGFNTYGEHTTAGSMVMRAGANTIRLISAAPPGFGFNTDYFQLNTTGQAAGTLTGAVTNATAGGAPVEGVLVTITNPNAGDAIVGTATTNAQGQYTVLLPAGTYTVTPSRTGFTGTAQTVTITAGGTVTANFQLTQGRVTGTVTNQLNQPIAGTTVTVRDITGVVLNTGVTSASGQFDIAVPAGAARVEAGAPWHINAAANVTVGANTVQNLTLTKLSGGAPADLSQMYNQDFFATADNKQAHTVDGPYSLPAEANRWRPTTARGPGAVNLGGIPFIAPDPEGDLNMMDLVNNTTIDVPNGRYAAAVVIGTSSGPGNFPAAGPGTATINYADGSTGTAPFFLSDWGTPQTQEIEPRIEDYTWGAIWFPSRYVDDGREEFIIFHFYSVVMPVDPNKVVDSITLPADENGLSAPNPFIWAVSMANAAVQPGAQAMRALRIAGGLEPAPTGAAFTALNVVNTGTSANRIDMVDAVTLMKQGQ